MDSIYRILIVDDEANICDLLQQSLASRSYQCSVAYDARQALERLKEATFDAVLLDIRMPGMSGLELLSQIRSLHPGIAAVMLTAVDEVETAVDCMKAGASDYITKPFDLDRVDVAVRTALESKAQAAQNSPEKITDEDINSIEAIARGVEARQEMLDVHSEIVVQQTVGIARQMGLPEEKIQTWTSQRAEQLSRKMKHIVDSIVKLSQSPEPSIKD